jgi:hypothetical protein
VNKQLGIFGTPPFANPVRFGSYQYVPILKTLPGELRALTYAPEGTWEQMTPLIEVATKKGASEDPPERSPLPNLGSRLVRAIGTARPFYLDFRWLSSRSKILVRRGAGRTPVRAMAYVLDDCRHRGLVFIPVVAPTKDTGRATLMREAIAEDGRGVCFRIPVVGVARPTGSGLDQELSRLLESVGAEPGSSDLLLDLGYLGPEPGFDAEHLLRLLAEIPDLLSWRSVFLNGTVIPQALSGYQEGGITELPRQEWRLWKELRESGAPRLPTFGDYGIQHPLRPESSGPGMRANIRYTTEEVVLVARGRSIMEHGTAQYRDLCIMLSERPEFRGADYSWGDRAIAECAEGLGTPGGQEHWRAVGTSHHLRQVIESLERLTPG